MAKRVVEQDGIELKKIAVEITNKLRRSSTVDWQVRDSVRARLKILVRGTLQRWKYPPDKAEDAVDPVLKQKLKPSPIHGRNNSKYMLKNTFPGITGKSLTVRIGIPEYTRAT